MFHPIMYFLIFYVNILSCNCIEPITSAAAAVGVALSGAFAGYKYLNCKSYECCDAKWIKYNQIGLEKEMDNSLFGQHLVKFIVLRSLKAHLGKREPKKALVMAFHGGTGSGKNHVSKMISHNLFREGSNSQYVHVYIGMKDFKHEKDLDSNRYELQQKIMEKTKLCDRSLFIFDEVDKMTPGLLDALTPYLDFHENIDGIDYRKNIFIFLSNSGASNITKQALKFWSEGKKREALTLKDVERLLTKGAFNEKGGLQHSDIVKRDLIDVYVPFLPLEKKHVKQCIQAELQSRHMMADVDMIANQLEYIPPEIELFAENGCKLVARKVDIFA